MKTPLKPGDMCYCNEVINGGRYMVLCLAMNREKRTRKGRHPRGRQMYVYTLMRWDLISNTQPVIETIRRDARAFAYWVPVGDT